MGTSLSGLTPATTFDGLLKTSDNEPLDGTLKAISTGDGTDTILQLSDSALSIGGDVTITGTTNDDTANSLLIERLDGIDLFQVRNDRNIYFGSTQYIRNGYRFYGDWEAYGTWDFNSDVNIGTGTGVANTRLLVKGSGATSATTSLLVQNSAGTQALKVDDDGAVAISDDGIVINGQIISRSGTKIQLGAAQLDYQVQSLHTFKTFNGTSYTEAMRITGTTNQFVGIGESTPTAKLHVKGSGSTSATFALKAQNSGGETMFSVRDDKTIQMDGSRFTFNSSAFTSYADILLNTDLAVGTTTIAANTRAHIKGSGATSATTALLVENSSGTDLLKIEDGGDLKIDNGVSNDLKVKISPIANKYLELDRQGRQVRIYSGATGNAGIFMTQQDKFSIGVNDTPLLLLDENSNVKIGSGITSADTSAKLQVDSTTQGFLPPRMTDAERDAITSPAPGLMVYNTTTNKAQCYNGTTWNDLF